MPRHLIKLPDTVEYLSILDEDGRVDKALDPRLPDDLLRKLHRAMVGAREFDARLLSLQRQGRVGTFPPITGQEASQLGPVSVLNPSDWLVPSFREGAAEVWRGRSLESVILATNGFNEGAAVEPERNDLPVSIPVGSQSLHAVGIAWGMKYRNASDVAMVFFGDGATSEGDVHEALNFAGVYRIPVIFVCQNNQWAISIPRAHQTRSETIAQKAVAYGIRGIQVDGNDILATHVAAKEAVERARAGEGATLIECVTYRVMMHTTADDPKRYRSDQEVETWRNRDPLRRFEIYLKERKLLTDAEAEAIRNEARTEIDEAVKRAETRMRELTDPLHMFEHLYAEPPSHLVDQKRELAEELAAAGKEE